MTADLEREIRDALHHRAHTVQPDALRPVQAIPPRRTRPHAAWRALAVAAVVAALAIAVSVATWHSGARRTPPGGGPAVTTVPRDKTTWRLIESSSPDGTVVRGVVGSAGLNFKPHRNLLGSDGVDTIDASYRPTADGFRITTIDVEPGRYSGHDRRVLGAKEAIDALFGGRAGATVDVHSQLRGTHLTLTAFGYILVFRFQG